MLTISSSKKISICIRQSKYRKICAENVIIEIQPTVSWWLNSLSEIYK